MGSLGISGSEYLLSGIAGRVGSPGAPLLQISLTAICEPHIHDVSGLVVQTHAFPPVSPDRIAVHVAGTWVESISPDRRFELAGLSLTGLMIGSPLRSFRSSCTFRRPYDETESVGDRATEPWHCQQFSWSLGDENVEQGDLVPCVLRQGIIPIDVTESELTMSELP